MTRWLCAWLAAAAVVAAPVSASDAKKDTYRGWESLALRNGLVEVQAVPAIGGRVMQFKLGDFEYLWVNDALAGRKPTETGLGAEGEWLNYGGDKLWPAPQGWDGEDQWPGPPDAILDGSPHAATIMTASGKAAAIQLVSRDDQRSGIRFSRMIRIHDNSTQVSFDSTMTNIDTRPRRWGIWQVTQLDAGRMKLSAYAPINPKSMHRRGYVELYGGPDHPSFRVDRENKVLATTYQRRVGKVGLDCTAGWAAAMDEKTGHVFAEMFAWEKDRKYPDDASVEFWLNGPGRIVVGGKAVDIPDDPAETPSYLESEILSPLAEIKPGESYSFHLDWFAARVGGEGPISHCTAAGATRGRFQAELAGDRIKLNGRFGVFHPGRLSIQLHDADSRHLVTHDPKIQVSPTTPVDLEFKVPVHADAASVVLVLHTLTGRSILLNSAEIEK